MGRACSNGMLVRMPNSVASKLNFGCGSRLREGWVNIDFASGNPAVIKCDLNKALPFSDKYFSFVYSSHVLEHFSKSHGHRILKECYRIMKSGAAIRCVVPDLELLVNNYLGKLNAARQGNCHAALEREWAVLALLDQSARDKPGGEMMTFLQEYEAENLTWIFETEGLEIEANHARLRTATPGGTTVSTRAWEGRLLRRLWPSRRRIAKAIRLALAAWPGLLPPSDRMALQVGRFRAGGEVHRWMYDSYSMGVALEAAGFVDVIQRSAFESYLSNWSEEHLDTEPNGEVYKPASLFMEARKP
jgi:predicted SAM-dependent methyltransferase